MTNDGGGTPLGRFRRAAPPDPAIEELAALLPELRALAAQRPTLERLGALLPVIDRLGALLDNLERIGPRLDAIDRLIHTADHLAETNHLTVEQVRIDVETVSAMLLAFQRFADDVVDRLDAVLRSPDDDAP